MHHVCHTYVESCADDVIGEHQCTGADIEKEDCRSDQRYEKQGGGAVRFRHGGGGGGEVGCCLAEEGEEPYMKWGGVATPPPCIRPWCTVLPHNNAYH